MTHPAYLLARLNAKNVRFDVGSGGIPDLTPQDIAAALAFVPRGMGRELLCRVWWPDGATLTARDLSGQMEAAQREEWASRESAMLDAMLAVASHTGGASLHRAQGKYASAHAKRWPKWVTDPEIGTLSPGYERTRIGVLAELSKPGLCPACGGRGDVMAGDVLAICAGCKGTGRRQVSDQWRAEALQITGSGYLRTWRPVYEWTLQLCVDALATASRRFAEAVD